MGKAARNKQVRRDAMAQREASRAAVRELYERVPALACQGRCQDSCGPIEMSTIERKVLDDRGFHIPPVTMKSLPLLIVSQSMCPALSEGRCSVYDDRPMLCRLWGATVDMSCPWGCEPIEGPLLDSAQGRQLLRESFERGGKPTGGIG